MKGIHKEEATIKDILLILIGFSFALKASDSFFSAHHPAGMIPPEAFFLPFGVLSQEMEVLEDSRTHGS